MDETWLDAEEKRVALRRVAAYRALCDRVRRSALGTLFSGGLMFAIWYFVVYPAGQGWSPFGLVFFGLAVLELFVGLLNRVFPSAEGVLLEALLLLAFGGWNLGRQIHVWQGGGRAQPPLLVIGAISFLQGVSRVRDYFNLRREFAERPSAEHIRWFDGLAREVRDADPQADPMALSLATEPHLTAKLLGDTAFFSDRAGEVIIVAQEEVVLEMEIPDPERPPVGFLTISGVTFQPFTLTRANWENYCAWKGEPA
jgi:hypothetical protein